MEVDLADSSLLTSSPGVKLTKNEFNDGLSSSVSEIREDASETCSPSVLDDSSSSPVTVKVPLSSTGERPRFQIPLDAVTAADSKLHNHLKYLNNISIKPGQNWFVSWYMVSVHFPLIAASCGPLANMLAVVALVDPWKVETDVSQSRKSVHRDLVWILSCNGVSLFCGCLANISLLLNFSGRVRYNVSQAISIGGFLTGSLILIALVIASNSVYDFNNPINASEYKPSQGYWYAVITASMYFLCFIMLLMNEIGHIRGIYGASFNLNRPQRSFMLQNIAYVGWILGGAGLFTFLLSEHVSYPDAIYYAQVTVLTIGFGDFHATSILGRALCLPYALVGILLLGLIVNSIRQIILKSGSYTVMWHFSETNRRHGLKKKPVNNLQESSDQNEKTNLERASFHNIRKIHNNARRYYKWFTLFISLLTFLIFMGLGAMVFLFAESWSYFTAIYFCSLSVLTIGYGDTVPTNSAGKAFFVVWSFVAVPTMTILVTSLLETIVKWVIVVTDRFGGWAFGNQSELRHQTQKLRDSMSRFQASSTQSLPQRPSAHKHRRNRHRHDHESPNNNPNEVSNTPGTQSYNVHFDDNSDQNNLGDEEIEIEGEAPSSSPSTESTFEKRLAQALDNPKIDSLSTEVKYLVEICKALDQSMRMVLAEPDKKYTFDEWNNMIELSQRHSSILDKSSVNQASSGGDNITDGNDEIGLNWLADDSPLRYPIQESRVFSHSYFRALENGLLALVNKEVQENHRRNNK